MFSISLYYGSYKKERKCDNYSSKNYRQLAMNTYKNSIKKAVRDIMKHNAL